MPIFSGFYTLSSLLMIALFTPPTFASHTWEDAQAGRLMVCEDFLASERSRLDAEARRWENVKPYHRGLINAWKPLIGNHKIMLTFGNGLSIPPVTGRILAFRVADEKQGSVEIVIEGSGVSSINGKARAAQQVFPLKYIANLQVVSESALSMSQEEGKLRELGFAEYYRRIEEEFRNNSKRLEADIKTKGSLFSHIGIVGAGPHGSVAAANFRMGFPESKGLVVSDNFGTFNTLGAFRVNTVETMEDSGNTFPNSPIQISNLNPLNKRFVEAEKHGWVGLSTLRFSGADVLLGQNVKSITKDETNVSPNKFPFFKMTTASGLVTRHNVIFAATGLGRVEARVAGAEKQQFVDDQLVAVDQWLAEGARDSRFVPKIMTVNQLQTLSKIDEENNRDPKTRWKRVKVGVVGGGDGGNIAVERFAANTEIFWLGQKSTTADEFLAQYEGYPLKAERYGDIADYYARDQIKPYAGYLYSFERIDGSLNLIISTDKSAKGIIKDQPSVDLLVLANGYKNRVNDLFTDLVDGDLSRLTILPVFGHTDEFSRYEDASTEVLGQQVYVDGQALPIFIVGNAANIPVTDITDVIATGGYLDVLLARTAALANQVGAELRSSVTRVPRRRNTSAPGQHFVVDFKAPANAPQSSRLTSHHEEENIALSSRSNAEIEMRTLLAQVIAFKLKVSESSPISIEMLLDNGNSQLRTTGLPQTSIKLLAEELKNNTKLVHALRILLRHRLKSIRLSCECRSGISAKLEELKVIFEYERGTRI